MKLDDTAYVAWFRDSAPYINAFRGRTFVLVVPGEMLAEAQFPNLTHDIALLNSLGVRLVLVHGIRPQVEGRLRERGAAIRYVNNLRVTDDAALACVKEAAGTVRVEIEALLSMGLANSPMAGARIRVASGNVVTARPLGVREGVDYMHTGEVRRVDAMTVERQLGEGAIVLLSPIGFSPTGEVFNLTAEDVGVAVAAAVGADKLILFTDGDGFADGQGALVRELGPARAREAAADAGTPEEARRALAVAARACAAGIRRVHLLNRHRDGALLLELFTRDGVGSMVTADGYEDMRRATIDDVGGILELIAPQEEQGILVRRSRDRLETEIENFTVIERDGMVIGCAAVLPFAGDGVAELACLTVHPDYRQTGRARALLARLEREAREAGLARLFVLTTRTAHWFLEHGFAQGEVSVLPAERQQLYNYQRNSKVFVKDLS